MSWLSRSLPVSAGLHAAAGFTLFLLPAFGPEALPEPHDRHAGPLRAAVIVLPPPSVPVTPGGGGGRRRAPTIPAPIRIDPVVPEPASVDDPGVGLVADAFPGGPDGEAEGTGVGGPGPALAGSGGEGAGGPGAPVRPGGDIQPPVKLRHVAPVYPELARRAGVQGLVVLECVIDPSGRVDRVKVLRGHPLLDAAAVEAVRQWRYTPTRLNGVPVAVLLTVTVQFRLPR